MEPPFEDDFEIESDVESIDEESDDYIINHCFYLHLDTLLFLKLSVFLLKIQISVFFDQLGSQKKYVLLLFE